jgi:hypothetical protein
MGRAALSRGLLLWLGTALWAGCVVTSVVYEDDPGCTRQCAVKPTDLVGSRQAGEACTYAQECLPVCCSCGSSTGDTVLLAGCRLGKCLKPQEVCLPSTMGTLCAQRDKANACNTPSGTPP